MMFSGSDNDDLTKLEFDKLIYVFTVVDWLEVEMIADIFGWLLWNLEEIGNWLVSFQLFSVYWQFFWLFSTFSCKRLRKSERKISVFEI